MQEAAPGRLPFLWAVKTSLPEGQKAFPEDKKALREQKASLAEQKKAFP